MKRDATWFCVPTTAVMALRKLLPMARPERVFSFHGTSLRLLALMVLLVFSGCTASGSGSSTQEGLAALFNDARDHPDHRKDAVSGCFLLLLQSGPDPEFAALLAGLFDVPVEQAERAYCAAMVEASIANEITECDLERLQVPREVRGAAPFGDMLRKALVAHERLQGQQAFSQPGLKAPPAPAS